MLNRMQSPEQMGFIETLLESTGNSSAFNHSTSHAVIRLRDLDASCFFLKKNLESKEAGSTNSEEGGSTSAFSAAI